MAEKILEVKKITKRYPGVVALKDVDLYIGENEVVGIAGENGAGKSTLLNILSGITQPDNGKIFLRGEEVKLKNHHEATMRGISRVFQEQALVPNLTVYENMLLTHEDRFQKFGIHLDRKAMSKTALEELRLFQLDIDPGRITSSYDFSTRQAIEIAKACSVSTLLGIEKPVILLDEPTAALTKLEIRRLFEHIARLRQRASLVFISHRLSEVLEVCDRVYVFKDGQVVDMVYPDRTSETRLHELMVGRKRDADYYREDRQRESFGPEVLRVVALEEQGVYEDVNLVLNEGEIVGIGGVLGSGKSEVGRAIAGIRSPLSGEVRMGGLLLRKGNVGHAIDNGVGYVPHERHAEGIILYFPISWNMSLSSWREKARGLIGRLDLGWEKQEAKKHIASLRVKTPSHGTLCYQLSGGNQQKVVLSKWLAKSNTRVLILDNPTRGVDAGAKEEIYSLLRSLVEEGLSILLISDELLELIGMCNRIVVMKDGKIANEITALTDNKPNEHQLIEAMV